VSYEPLGRRIPTGTGAVAGRLQAMTATLTLLDLTPAMATARLREWISQRGLPAYRAEQLARRLWQNPVAAWADASELPAELRAQLDAELPLARLEAEVVQTSSDGTRKYLWRLSDGEKIESVLIPTATRRTLCISSQAGCALGCTFCATGLMGFRRNLRASEIAGQVREVILRNPADKPTNIVFMGMGEPLLNWAAVDTSLSILNQPDGCGIGARHITVSTVGIVPGMKALAARPEQFRLAISLHSPLGSNRIALMPIEKKYPLRDVLQAAEAFRKRITFEYVMIADRNDRDEDCGALISLARRLGAHVNLLPLHPGGDPTLRPSRPARIREFREQLAAAGVEAVVRRSRGLDIDAACGQLHVKMAKRERRPQEV
jgi:23S rRNA (adenine2503-C2)-methyltransferase